MPYSDISPTDILNPNALHQPSSWNESSIWMPRLADVAIQRNHNTIDKAAVGSHTSRANEIELSLAGQGLVSDTTIDDPVCLIKSLMKYAARTYML